MTDQPSRDLATFFPGSRPSLLRVEWRSDGKVRLRIESLGCPDAMVDLTAEARSDLADTLSYGPPEAHR
jgi:hypothetical protein